MKQFYDEVKEYDNDYDFEDDAWLDIQITRNIYNYAKKLARKENVSLNSFIENAIREKVLKML